ncbi:MAG: erythromycin esterase family protein [Arenimonas sp.]
MLIALTLGAQIKDSRANDRLDPALRQVVAEVCSSRMVFLGEEGSHGGAVAFAVKAQLVEELVGKCNFRHVAFESQVYDFEDLKQRYAAGTATQAALFDAVGALWSTASEMEPVLHTLHAKAQAGELVLSGIDGQIGSSTGIYTQQRLGGALSAVLAEPGRGHCKATIDRLTSWTFDAEHPNDDAYKQAIAKCLDAAQAAAGNSSSVGASTRLLIRSFRDQLKFSETDYSNQRDRLMYENLAAIVHTLPAGTKTVVWTANVHAARQPFDGRAATAGYFADQDPGAVRSIGIAAVSGSYGRQGRVASELQPAIEGSLEMMAAPKAPSVMNYVSSKDLSGHDGQPSRLLGYASYKQAAWSRLFDGVIILRSEHQPNFIRSQQPQQPIGMGSKTSP